MRTNKIFAFLVISQNFNSYKQNKREESCNIICIAGHLRVGIYLCRKTESIFTLKVYIFTDFLKFSV